MRRYVLLSVIALSLAACASSSSKQARSEFEDIPVPSGLTLDWNKSTVIESPSVKAARLVYKGRIPAGQPRASLPDHARGQWLAPPDLDDQLGKG